MASSKKISVADGSGRGTSAAGRSPQDLATLSNDPSFRKEVSVFIRASKSVYKL